VRFGARSRSVQWTLWALEFIAQKADAKCLSIGSGIQSQGRQATIKHLVCNDSETSRREYDVQVDERVLREVYLRPFEIAIKESDPSSIMAAYNVVVSRISIIEVRGVSSQHSAHRFATPSIEWQECKCQQACAHRHCARRVEVRRLDHERLVWNLVSIDTYRQTSVPSTDMVLIP
jgi:hypothetical protein